MRAVLFDLDGTLLDLDLGGFLERYFAALGAASAPLAERASGDFMTAMHEAVGAMMEEHGTITNRDVFYDALLARTGIDLNEHWDVYERFYEEVFPTLGEGTRPARGARRAVTAALDAGLKVAVATNPIFPRRAIEHRLAWAGLADLSLAVLTSYEDMIATKPHAAYFRQVAEMLGVPPHECLMVGDDRRLDMPAADIGMRTYYVGTDADAAADMRGNLDELAEVLPRLV